MQYYVSFGGENYVDLGLGNHRVKCRVHKGFRYIMIELNPGWDKDKYKMNAQLTCYYAKIPETRGPVALLVH